MYDLIIAGGSVIDGSGKPPFPADVALTGGVIAAVGDLRGRLARQRLDAEGLSVSPGFIDAHAHSDTAFLADTSSASKLYQGITTEVSGNCGSSPFPWAKEIFDAGSWRCASFEHFLERFDAAGHAMAVNQALLVGHGNLRRRVIGEEGRKATPAELGEMRGLLARELASGAWGLSLGLEYAPGCFADQAELNALGEVVRAHDGVVTCHMRSEGLEIDRALEELFEVGRRSGARVNISHLKLDNYQAHGRAPEVWASIERARQEGLRVSADMYPYTASCTSLSIRCPRWSLDGGDKALLSRLAGGQRQAIVEGIREHYFSAERAETCLFCDDGGLWPEIRGKTLREVAQRFCHTSDYAEAAALVLEKTRAQTGCIFFVMSEADMLYFLRQDIGIGSDGYALSADPKKLHATPHPRSYGAIAEFFRLAREKGVCPLQEAVRRVTSKPAAVFGMKGRGLLKEGYAADITVFDPALLAPRASYLQPVQLAQGVKHVIVNGRAALLDGQQTDLRPGRFLRKTEQ